MKRIIILSTLVSILGFGLCAAFGAAHFAWTLLKGKYLFYAISSILTLVVLLSLILAAGSRRVVNLSSWRICLYSTMAGYTAGLFAFWLMPLARGDVKHVFTMRDIGGVFLLSPVIALSWLNGIAAGLLLVLARRLGWVHM